MRICAGQGKWVDPDAFNLGNGGMTQAEERTYFGLCKLLTPPWMMDTSLWRQLDYGTALASVGFMVWTRHQAGYVESFCRPRAESLIELLGSERDWSAVRVPAESAAADGQRPPQHVRLDPRHLRRRGGYRSRPDLG